MSAPEVLLATCALVPDGETDGHLLVDALAERGVSAAWAVWDDPAVDWAAVRLVAVRSTWDYHRRLAPFLAWARDLPAPLLNGVETFAWNADKGYLEQLADLVPTVPSRRVDDAGLVAALQRAVADYGTAVIKPATGAGGHGVCVIERWDDPRLIDLAAGPWILQPLVGSIRTHGESSVYVLDGVAVGQVDKHPGADDVRVHGAHGGRSEVVALDEERARLAVEAVAAVAELLGTAPAYARIDQLRWEDRWCVSEVELIEPGLYLDLLPANADRFAELVVRRLRR